MRLQIEHISKSFETIPVFNDVSLDLNSGQVIGLVAPNGTGKTVLLRLISGLLIPTSGTVSYDGKILGKDIDFPPSLGLMLEEPKFLDHLTGFKNLYLLASIKKEASAQTIANLMKRFGLDPDNKSSYKNYSLGMKQKLGIIAAIMEKPDLIILDEPTNALDKRALLLLSEVIKEQQQRGALILIASHNHYFLKNLAEVIYTFDEGKIRELTEDDVL